MASSSRRASARVAPDHLRRLSESAAHDFGHCFRGHQRDLCGNWKALANVADRYCRIEGAGLNRDCDALGQGSATGAPGLKSPGIFSTRVGFIE
jgi:hypothetical protein